MPLRMLLLPMPDLKVKPYSINICFTIPIANTEPITAIHHGASAGKLNAKVFVTTAPNR